MSSDDTIEVILSVLFSHQTKQADYDFRYRQDEPDTFSCKNTKPGQTWQNYSCPSETGNQQRNFGVILAKIIFGNYIINTLKYNTYA